MNVHHYLARASVDHGRKERGRVMTVRKQSKLTYKDGYISGQIDAEHNDNGAWLYDEGNFQPEQYMLGYVDGKNDYRAGDKL